MKLRYISFFIAIVFIGSAFAKNADSMQVQGDQYSKSGDDSSKKRDLDIVYINNCEELKGNMSIVRTNTTIGEILSVIEKNTKNSIKLHVDRDYSGIKIQLCLLNIRMSNIMFAISSGLSNKGAEWRWVVSPDKKTFTLKPSAEALQYREKVKGLSHKIVSDHIRDIQKELNKEDSGNDAAKNASKSTPAQSLFPYLNSEFPGDKLTSFIFSGREHKIDTNSLPESSRNYIESAKKRLFKNENNENIDVFLESRVFSGSMHPALTLSMKSGNSKKGFGIVGSLLVDTKISDALANEWPVKGDSLVAINNNLEDNQILLKKDIEYDKMNDVFKQVAVFNRPFIYFSLPDEDDITKNSKVKFNKIDDYLVSVNNISPDYIQHKYNGDIVLLRKRVFPFEFNVYEYIPAEVVNKLNDWPFSGSGDSLKEFNEIKNICAGLNNSQKILISKNYKNYENFSIWSNVFKFLYTSKISADNLFSSGVRVSNLMKDSFHDIAVNDPKLAKVVASNQLLYVKVYFSTFKDDTKVRKYDFKFYDKNNTELVRVPFIFKVNK